MHEVLIAEALGFHTKTEKQHVGEIMFETLDVPSLCFKAAAALALYQSGRSTGIEIFVIALRFFFRGSED